MAGDNPLDTVLFDPNSINFVNRMLGLTIKPGEVPTAPPNVGIDPTLEAKAKPPTAPPVPLNQQPVKDPLAQPQPYQSRVLAPGGPAAEFLEYQKKINDQARSDAMWDQLGGSIKGVGAAWSMNPSHVSALSHGGGGGQVPLPAGPMSSNDFLSFQAKTEEIRKAAIAENGLKAVAASLGLTVDQARALRENNPAKFGEALDRLTPEQKAAASRAERGVQVQEKQAETQAEAERRQREKLTTIEQPGEKRTQTEFDRSRESLSDDEVKSAAQQLGENPNVIRGMKRAEVEARLARVGAPPEDVKSARAIEAERRGMVPPANLSPEEEDAWRRQQETPTEAYIRRKNEIEATRQRDVASAGPEASDFIKKQDEAQSTIRTFEADSALRSKQREALGQGVIAGSSMAEAGLELSKLWTSLHGDAPMPKVAPTETLQAIAALRLQQKAKTSGLGAGQGFTDKDASIVANSIGGNIKQTPESMRRIMALEEQMDRYKQDQLNEDIKARRLAQPGMASRSSVKPIALGELSPDVRRFSDNSVLASALGSDAGRKSTEGILGKSTVKDLIDSPAAVEATIQSKLSNFNPQNKLYDKADTVEMDAFKNSTVKELEAERAATIKRWADHGQTDRDSTLFDMILAAKKAGKFGAQ